MHHDQSGQRRDAFPICLDCAGTDMPRGYKPREKVHDHKSKDGPHA